MEGSNRYPLCDLIDLTVDEIVRLVEVLVLEHALANHLVRHLPLHVHHVLEHVVVGLSGEEDPSSVQLVDSAPG